MAQDRKETPTQYIINKWPHTICLVDYQVCILKCQIETIYSLLEESPTFVKMT